MGRTPMRVMAADEAEGEASKRGATVLAYLPGGTAESGVKGMYDQVCNWQHIVQKTLYSTKCTGSLAVIVYRSGRRSGCCLSTINAGGALENSAWRRGAPC